MSAPTRPFRKLLVANGGDIAAIIACAKACCAEAIHPGYGFLSENLKFATRCREEGIVFIGPSPEAMAQVGDMRRTKELARRCEVTVIEDREEAITDIDVAKREAERIGYPIMAKTLVSDGDPTRKLQPLSGTNF